MGDWVEQGFCIGFMTTKGVLLDLDNMTLKKAKWIAKTIMETFQLEGFLLIQSSAKSYHAVFNKYVSWKKLTNTLFYRPECIRYAIQQIQNGHLTLRISKKNGKNKPKIILKFGKADKLIKDYLEVYNKFNPLISL